MESLRIFVCSDQHEQWDNLNMVTDWFQNENKGKPFDLVLLCGDQANCKNNSQEPDNPEDNRKASESNRRYIETLEKFTEAGRLFYIPGNHDSAEMYQDVAPKWGNSHNIHCHSMFVTSGLSIAGLGGSADIFTSGLTGDQAHEQIWPLGTYPYDTEEKLVGDFQKLQERIDAVDAS